MRLRWHSERLVSSVARKRIVFVIVEGPSDEEALGVLLGRIYDRSSVFVHIMHGDITTQRGVWPERIEGRLAKEVQAYASSNHYTRTDFREIIHIVDMDGAYIPPEKVVQDAAARRVTYAETEIRTRNKEAIESRNQQKAANLDRLCGCDSIWGVPYRVFYMSCNLDHVLYNKLNSSNAQKEEDAYQFAKAYRNALPEFLAFLSNSDFSVRLDYESSWAYIKQGLHSLERHTNLGLCFPKQAAKAAALDKSK